MNRTRILFPLGVAALLGVALLFPQSLRALGPIFSDSPAEEAAVPVGGFFKKRGWFPLFRKGRKQKRAEKPEVAATEAGPMRQVPAGTAFESAGRFPIDLAVTTSTGKITSLAEVMEAADSRAVLIDFWASWCGPCLESMPQLKRRAASLDRLGVAVAGMNVEGNPRAAESIRRRQGIEFSWLMEPPDEPFSRQFRIDSIPRVILVSRAGEVLFNGHPEDRSLDRILNAFRNDTGESADTDAGRIALQEIKR